MDPRVLTDWECLAATSDELLNLYIDREDCACEGTCTCQEEGE